MIDRLIDFSLRNRLLILGLTLLVVAAGLYTVRTNPVDAIPDLSETQVIVFADWPGRSPQEVEDQVTYPMTVNLQGLAGVKAVRASSAFGFAMVNVIFEDGTDLYFGRQRILERMNLIQGLMPKGVTPVLGPDASAVGQVFWYTLEGEGRDLGELRALEDWFVRYQLNAVPGVAEVASIGGFVREYQIDLDPNKLAAAGVSLREVMAAVERSNDNVGGKTIEQNGMEYVVRGIGLIRGLRGIGDIGDIAVSASGGVPVHLSSLGTIHLGPAFRRGALEKDGREVVGGVVTMRYGESAPAIIARVKAKVREVEKGLPAGVRIVPAYDRSALIARAVGTLKHSLLEEILLVVLAHVLFLLHFRSVLIVSAPLPVAVLIAFLLMRAFGITSNIMSLMGIAIAIGVLVDAGIVITENCFRQIEREGERGGTPRPVIDSVRDAAQQIGRPIFFSMVIIVLAFFPVFSLTGEEGRLFHPLAFTKTFAMIGATFLAVTLVPVLASFLIRGKVHREDQNPLMRGARRLYEPALGWALRHKPTTLLAAGGAFLLSLVLVGGAGLLLAPVKLPVDAAAAAGAAGARRLADRLASGEQWLDSHLAAGVGKEFMPPLDEGTLMFMPVTSNAISLTEAVEIMKKQDAVLRSFPEVAAVIGKVGRVESPLDPAPINMYETLVELKDRARWRPGLSKDALIAEMTEKSRMPGVTTIWQQPIRNRIDMLATGIPTQVGVKIFGPDLAVLEAKAHAVAAAVREVRGVVDVYPEQILGTPYLEIEVDRDAVARYGATVGDVEDVIAAAVGGMDLTTTIEGRERFAVRVRYARELRDDLAAVRRVLVPVRSPTGVGMAQVPLAELAAIRLRPGPSMISSENGLLRERVFLNVRGRDVGSFVDEAKRVIGQRVPLPPGYFLEWSGQYENQLRARNRLLVVVPACFAIIFVLLWLTYRSAREAAHVILAIPFALTGGNLLLWALHAAAMHYGWKTEFHLSVAVWVGYIALFGTAVQTAVVMVVYLEEALHRKAAAGELTRESIRQAAVEGAVLRLRPKLMTVSTVIAGLLPILWSTETGSEVAKPIATPVLGGMLSSLVHVLIVTPVIWTMIKEWELRRGRLDAGAASGLRRSSMTHTNLMAAALAALLLIAAPALAQHEHPQPPAEPPSAPSPEDQSGNDMQGMEGMPGMAGMDHSKHEMHAVLGPYSMTREASGTSWQPDSAPHGGLHRMTGPWELMTHGYAMVVHDDQKGPRGDTRTFSETMWMGMANRPLGPGRLGLRAMVSAEPWTIGKAGYPLLLQTGETANGVTPLVDRQHPHDLFMELSGSYSVPLGSDTADSSAFLYLGLPGEPALGPPAFMHRFSGLDNPEAPLAHHWLDSTHVTFGVATLGWVRGPWKLEGSVFTGREPDQNRTDLESPKMDSWSVRVSFNPAPDWALQASYGHLHSPEQLAPEVDTDRATLSAIYNRPLADGNWQTTLAWGRNARDPGTTTDAWLLESAASRGRHTLFGRAERQGNDELFGHGIAAGGPDRAGEVFTVGKLSLGYIYDVISTESGKLGLGALGSVALIPGELKDVYGNRPVSWLGFVRVRV